MNTLQSRLGAALFCLHISDEHISKFDRMDFNVLDFLLTLPTHNYLEYLYRYNSIVFCLLNALVLFGAKFYNELVQDHS